MAKTDFKSIDEYQAGFPADIQERMQAIRKIIHKVVPDVEETLVFCTDASVTGFADSTDPSRA